jgi:hypothetical protein
VLLLVRRSLATVPLKIRRHVLAAT